jgi:hypothetical protein
MFVLASGELMNFSDLLDVTQNTINMTSEPEDLIIVPR